MEIPMPGTSADTIRAVPLHLTVPIGGFPDLNTDPFSDSQPGSPPSSLPSPSSPSGDSVSSFPSVSSSFIFSSQPATPPQIDAEPTGHLTAQADDNSELIIPSLTLPSLVKRPTPYGQTLGDIKLIVLGHASSRVESEQLLRLLADEEYEDFVDVGKWEDFQVDSDSHEAPQLGFRGRPRIRKVSTDWIEHRDAHGLEKYEPTRNIEIVRLPDFDSDQDSVELIRSVLAVIHKPFRSVLSLLNTERPPDHLLVNLLSSGHTPLYTVLLLLVPDSPSKLDKILISELNSHVPVIVLPPLSRTSSRPASFSTPSYLEPLDTPSTPSSKPEPHTSSVRPPDPYVLRTLLLRTPEDLATLRLEAAERFLRWREVERSVQQVLGEPSRTQSESVYLQTPKQDHVFSEGDTSSNPSKGKRRRTTSSLKWDKARWEAEWEGTLSKDVARTLRQRKRRMNSSRSTDERRMTITANSSQVRPRPSQSPTQSRRPSQIHGQKYPQPHVPARQQQRRRMSSSSTTLVQTRAQLDPEYAPHPNISLDPLHFSSILSFSLSLLSPLRSRIFGNSQRDTTLRSPSRLRKESGWGIGIVLSAFCAGIGVGFLVAKSQGQIYGYTI